MSENKDPERVKIKAMELGEMIERFKQIHADYHSLLDVEEERGESQRYFDDVDGRLVVLETIIGKWIEEAETNQNLLTPFAK